MKTTFPWKQALLLFAAVLLAYLGVFQGIERSRKRKGPWEVDFIGDIEGRPLVLVRQPYLNISMALEFPDEGSTNQEGRVTFDVPKKPLPYGRLLYEDLTFLPGVVTLDLFGHEVELLPRVLIVNRKEMPWTAGRIQLWSTNKPPVPPKPAKGY